MSARFLFMGEQQDPAFDEIEARGITRIYDGTSPADHRCAKCRRDEWSCPCCGRPNDGSYCAPCSEAECGERDALTACREGCLAEAKP